MMDEFRQLLMKKKQSQGNKPLDEHKMKAKADMAKSLSDMLGSDITEDMKKSGVKKITVASDSTEGMREGLDQAEEIIDPDEELESEHLESEEHEEMMASSPSKLQDKIAELEKQLEELKSSKRA